MTDAANTKHIGDLIVTKKNAATVTHITEVTGYLYICDEGAALPVLTSVGGSLYIAIGIQFDHSHIEFGAGQVLAVWEYALHVKDGQYRAGCRGPWSAAQALAHWHAEHHAPPRAKTFRAAIDEHEATGAAV